MTWDVCLRAYAHRFTHTQTQPLTPHPPSTISCRPLAAAAVAWLSLWSLERKHLHTHYSYSDPQKSISRNRFTFSPKWPSEPTIQPQCQSSYFSGLTQEERFEEKKTINKDRRWVRARVPLPGHHRWGAYATGMCGLPVLEAGGPR